MIKKLLLALLIGIGSMALFVALSTTALVGHGMYADGKANRAAEALCRSIPIGARIDSVAAAAAKRGDGNTYVFYEGQHHFRFQAGAFHTRDCIANTVDGRVVSLRVETNDD